MVFRPPGASSAIQLMSPSEMAASTLASVLVACMLTPTWALQVSPNSACASVCVDSLPSDFSDPNVSNTIGSDVVCNDENYGRTSAGAKFEGCLTCLQSSTASGGNENDQGWYFYNLRYAFSTCIFGAANASDSLSTPCSTSAVCEPLQKSLSDGMGTPLTASQYSYCSAYDNSFLGSSLDTCRDCLKSNSDTFFLSNFLTALQAGCTQRPPTGFAVGLNDTLFSKNQVKMTSPSSTPGKKDKGGLSQGAIIGIAITGVVVLLMLIAVAFICMRKRRTAKRLKQLQSPLDERFGAENITAPHHGAYSSPQTSPPLKEEEHVQMSRAPKVRNFSLLRQLPQRAGEWQGTGVQPSPHSTHSSNPPLYSPPRPNRESIPAHHAYIPPEYTPSSRNSTSPLYLPQPPSPPQQPPQPLPATHPQRTPPPVSLDATVRNTLPSGPRASVARNTSNSSNVLPTGPGASVARNPRNASPSPPGPQPLATSHSRNTSNASTALPSAPPAAISRNASTTSKLQTQNLGLRRGFIPSPVQISGPIVKVENRLESKEQARKNRERLYKEGISSRSEDKEGARPSLESDTSEEMWPGSY